VDNTGSYDFQTLYNPLLNGAQLKILAQDEAKAAGCKLAQRENRTWDTAGTWRVDWKRESTGWSVKCTGCGQTIKVDAVTHEIELPAGCTK